MYSIHISSFSSATLKVGIPPCSTLSKSLASLFRVRCQRFISLLTYRTYSKQHGTWTFSHVASLPADAARPISCNSGNYSRWAPGSDRVGDSTLLINYRYGTHRGLTSTVLEYAWKALSPDQRHFFATWDTPIKAVTH